MRGNEGGSAMKVMLVNGSPHKNGCTHRALAEVAAALDTNGIESEIFWIGAKPAAGCMACGRCRETGACIFNDAVNEFRARAELADGFVFGAPVHYAHAASFLMGFMDRLFYSNGKAGAADVLSFKPAAAIASARRAGTTAALDDIQKFFTISNMPIVSSRYWNMVHGCTPEEVEQDQEGLWTMRQLGRNMAWLLKSLEAGREAGIGLPDREAGSFTSFIR